MAATLLWPPRASMLVERRVPARAPGTLDHAPCTRADLNELHDQGAKERARTEQQARRFALWQNERSPLKIEHDQRCVSPGRENAPEVVPLRRHIVRPVAFIEPAPVEPAKIARPDGTVGQLLLKVSDAIPGQFRPGTSLPQVFCDLKRGGKSGGERPPGRRRLHVHLAAVRSAPARPLGVAGRPAMPQDRVKPRHAMLADSECAPSTSERLDADITLVTELKEPLEEVRGLSD